MEDEVIISADQLTGLGSEDIENLEIEGLGVVRNLPAQQKKGIVKAINTQVRKAIVQKGVTKEQNLLVAKQGSLSNETQKKWAKGELMFRDAAHYVRKVVTTGSGILEVFDDTLNKVVGITDFVDQQLPSGVNMMVRRIELNYDTASGITEKTADFAPITNTEDNGLYNGEVEVRVGEKSVFRHPVNQFLQPDRKVVGSPANGVNLDSPFLIKEDQKVQILIHFAAAMTVGNAAYAEFVLKGTETSPR